MTVIFGDFWRFLTSKPYIQCNLVENPVNRAEVHQVDCVMEKLLNKLDFSRV